VFTPPVRAALTAPSYSAANRINRQSSPDRLGLSRQSYNLIGKLAELDALISPSRQRRIFEAHPEFAFALMNGGAPLAASKKTGEGRRRRIELLAQHGLGAATDAMHDFARRDAAPDDVLDAAALARTALRIMRGEAVRLPARPPRDSRGLKMEIWG
jgi:predicted RNase H-like nuclease